MSKEEVDEAAAICAAAGCWLLLGEFVFRCPKGNTPNPCSPDNTYEDFVFDGRSHYCSPLPHVVHVFSMSKAYGMMG